MTFSNNYHLFGDLTFLYFKWWCMINLDNSVWINMPANLSINTRYDTIRIHVQTYLKVSGLLIYQIIVFKKIMPSVKLSYNFILKIKMSGLQINHNYLKMSFVHKYKIWYNYFLMKLYNNLTDGIIFLNTIIWDIRRPDTFK
jgi:hypothetical protein